MKKIDWNEITNPILETNKSFALYFSKIEKLLDETAPVQQLNKKEQGLKERPWITNGILKSMNDRDNLYNDFTKENDPTKKNEIHTRYKKNATWLYP